MSVTALIKFTQGPNTDVAGVAVFGTLIDGAVTITNGDNTDVHSWVIELLEAPEDSALVPGVLDAGVSNTPSASFTPDVPGAYRIKMSLVGGDTDLDIRVFGVKDYRGFMAPPYQDDPLALSHLVKPDELNFGSQGKGWRGTRAAGMHEAFFHSYAKSVVEEIFDADITVDPNRADIFRIHTTAIGEACSVELLDSIEVGSSYTVLDSDGDSPTYNILVYLPGGQAFEDGDTGKVINGAYVGLRVTRLSATAWSADAVSAVAGLWVEVGGSVVALLDETQMVVIGTGVGAGKLTIFTDSGAQVGQRITGQAGQTANLFEGYKDAVPVFNIDADGVTDVAALRISDANLPTTGDFRLPVDFTAQIYTSGGDGDLITCAADGAQFRWGIGEGIRSSYGELSAGTGITLTIGSSAKMYLSTDTLKLYTLNLIFDKALSHPVLQQEAAAADTAGSYWSIRGQSAGPSPTAARLGGALYVYAGDGSNGGATWAAGGGGALGFYAGKPGVVGVGGGGVGGSLYFSSAAGTGAAANGTINFNGSSSTSWKCSGINFTNITDDAPITHFGTTFRFSKTQINPLTIVHETDTTLGNVRPALHIQAQSTTFGGGTGATLSLESGDGPTHGTVQVLLGGPAGLTVMEFAPGWINFPSSVLIEATGNPVWAFGVGGMIHGGYKKVTSTVKVHADSPYNIEAFVSQLRCLTVGGNFIANLPDATLWLDREIEVCDWDGHAAAGNISIVAFGGQTVNGLALITIVTDFGGCVLKSDGVAWRTKRATV